MCGSDCIRKIADQRGEGSRQRRDSGNENIVVASASRKRQHCRGHRAQAALGTVAQNRAADFAARGDAKAELMRLAAAFPRRAHFESKTGRSTPCAALGSQEIGPVLQVLQCRLYRRTVQADSLLRPCARRRAST